MDELFALFAREDDEGEGPPSAYGDEGDNIEIDVAEAEEEEEEEEEEHMEYRPVKRSRSVAAAVSPGVPGEEGGSRRGGGGAAASSGRLNDHEEAKEVIEILSDDEDAQPPPARSELFEDDLRNRLSANPEVDAPAVAAAPLFQDEFSNHVVRATAADLHSRMPAAGGAARSIERAGAGRDLHGGLKGDGPLVKPPSGGTGGVKIGFSMMASSVAARSHKQQVQQTAAAATGQGGAPPAAGSSDVDVVLGEGKPSVEEKDASTPASNGSAVWLGGVVAAAKAAVTSTINPSDDDVGIGGSTAAAAAAAASQELPRNLECAMCFNPLAVAALFACGHGSCWECAHDWCSRETSSTMDCPTCHVSIPRSDFRRCVVLDEVVDRAVTAAGMDDDEWRARVERGQKLAREAEGRRRSLRDAQRSAEDTIAEQAAELEKLREEAKSRRVGRRALRAQDGSTSSMADFGFRVLNGGNLAGGRRRGFFDPASQRSAVEEYTRRRVEEAAVAAGPASSSRQARVAAAGEAAAAAAAALGMPPSAAYGVVGPRGHAHHHPLSATAAAAAGSAGFGHAEGDPWFSLRPSQPSRGATGAMAPGRRMARETAGRGGSSGRSAGSSAAAAATMGLGQPAGAAFKSVHGHGRVGGGGTNWRSSAYLNPGRLSLSGGAGGGGGGGRARLHGSNARADPRGDTDVNVGPAAAGTPLDGGNLTNPGGGPGRSFTVQVPARSIRKAHGLSGLHGGGAIASGGPAGSAAAVAGTVLSYPNPLANGVGLAPPPSSSPSLHYSSSGGSQPSRGGGGSGGLPFGGRPHGRAAAAAAAAAPSPAPMLDLDELMAGHDDASSRSEWDDVLASISTPMQATDDARSNSPGATRG
ncbi:unnamed protein product [Ectocarpus sp. 6 AP-2014]